MCGSGKTKKIKPQIGVIKVMDYFLLQYFAFFFFFNKRKRKKPGKIYRAQSWSSVGEDQAAVFSSLWWSLLVLGAVGSDHTWQEQRLRLHPHLLEMPRNSRLGAPAAGGL